MNVDLKYKISGYLAEQRKIFSREAWSEAYQSWARGGHGWNRQLGLGGTDTQSAICWYQSIHRPGSKEWRPRIIIMAVARAAVDWANGVGPECKPDGTDGISATGHTPSPPVTPSKTASTPLTAPEQGGRVSKRLKGTPDAGAVPTNSGATHLGETRGAPATGAECISDSTDCLSRASSASLPQPAPARPAETGGR